MDTHISDFRKIKYAHVTIDTFSGFLVATALTGEATKNVISHCLHCFSMLSDLKHKTSQMLDCNSQFHYLF